MRKVMESEFDEPLEDEFAAFDETPIAAASIGQVYRATLHDGREVAVKVQYPRVAEAVRADLQNLGLLLRLMKRVAPGMDAKAIAREVTERIGEELDYELEAQNQRALARIFRGHPFIVVPAVIARLSRERVMVTEFVEGSAFDDAQGAAAGRPRPRRRDLLPLLLRLPVPPPPVLRRPASRQLPPPGRRAGRVPGLRALQADRRGEGRARDGLPARRRGGRRRRACTR